MIDKFMKVIFLAWWVFLDLILLVNNFGFNFFGGMELFWRTIGMFLKSMEIYIFFYFKILSFNF